MLRLHLIFIALLISIILVACGEKAGFSTPDKLGSKNRTKLITGEEAIKVIDELHGLAVTPSSNLIAEYGMEEKDLLYISYYDKKDKAAEALKVMINKMSESEKSPFSHMRALPDYDNKVYITLGMGAIHYIYSSSNYLLWLQTTQSFGRELPEDLLAIYPI